MEILVFINKWIHLLSISLIMGGTAFLVLVAFASKSNSEDKDEPVLRSINRLVGLGLGIAWVLALATGFINMKVVSATVNPVYNMYLGGKMSLAIVMFILTLAIAHPPKAGSVLRSLRGKILPVILVLGVIIVGISAHLNMTRMKLASATTAVTGPGGIANK